MLGVWVGGWVLSHTPLYNSDSKYLEHAKREDKTTASSRASISKTGVCMCACACAAHALGMCVPYVCSMCVLRVCSMCVLRVCCICVLHVCVRAYIYVCVCVRVPRYQGYEDAGALTCQQEMCQDGRWV